jgi:hypothetical protein
MGSRLLEVISLFQCSHQFGWPRRTQEGDYYQVCLVCGAEYDYDWTEMRRTEKRARKDRARDTASKRASQRSHRSWHPRERRLPWNVEVQFRSAGAREWLQGKVENISRTGLLLISEFRLDKGAHVVLELEMPETITGQRQFIARCTGQVARIAPDPKNATLNRIACTIEDYRFIGVVPVSA